MLTLVVIPLLLSIRAIPLAAAPARQSHLGLVAGYAFDEGAGATTADASGQGHIGALLGATWTPNGHAGAALSFDGNNDWVTGARSSSRPSQAIWSTLSTPILNNMARSPKGRAATSIPPASAARPPPLH